VIDGRQSHTEPSIEIGILRTSVDVLQFPYDSERRRSSGFRRRELTNRVRALARNSSSVRHRRELPITRMVWAAPAVGQIIESGRSLPTREVSGGAEITRTVRRYLAPVSERGAVDVQRRLDISESALSRRRSGARRVISVILPLDALPDETSHEPPTHGRSRLGTLRRRMGYPDGRAKLLMVGNGLPTPGPSRGRDRCRRKELCSVDISLQQAKLAQMGAEHPARKGQAA